ncbi:MAG: helix-turn-helix transcriptional regulator [Clostridia bacterium]|nr:helix-turn-helix transcriptional regulator [Clostridia bacterium]
MNKEYVRNYKNLGLNIAFYRKRTGYTQMQLAELIDIDRSHMSAIELGNVGASLDVIFKICDVLSISEKDLFDFRD